MGVNYHVSALDWLVKDDQTPRGTGSVGFTQTPYGVRGLHMRTDLMTIDDDSGEVVIIQARRWWWAKWFPTRMLNLFSGASKRQMMVRGGFVVVIQQFWEWVWLCFLRDQASSVGGERNRSCLSSVWSIEVSALYQDYLDYFFLDLGIYRLFQDLKFWVKVGFWIVEAMVMLDEGGDGVWWQKCLLVVLVFALANQNVWR